MSLLRMGEKWPNTCFIETQHQKSEQCLEQYHVHVLWWFIRRPMSGRPRSYGKHIHSTASKRTVGSRTFVVSQSHSVHTAIGRGADNKDLWRVDYSAINSVKGWRIINLRFRGDFERFESDLCIVKLFRDRKNFRKMA